MTPEGVLRAKETIVYRFGDDSGRHGIERYFITREPYNETEDQVYEISNITVETIRRRRQPVQLNGPTRPRAVGRSSSGCGSATRTRPSRPPPPRT